MRILTAWAAFFVTLALFAGAQVPTRQQAPPQSNGGKDTNAGNCGILYGKDHALTFCAPEGWVLDNGIMNDEGIYAVFYPDGSSFLDAKNSGTFMYFNVVDKAPESTVAKMMNADAEDVMRNAPKAVIQPSDPIKIGDLSAPVLRFLPGGFNRYEAVAYIGEEKVLVMIVMSSKSEAIFTKDYSSFVKLVQSYKFIGSEVNIEHK